MELGSPSEGSTHNGRGGHGHSAGQDGQTASLAGDAGVVLGQELTLAWTNEVLVRSLLCNNRNPGH